MNFESRAYLSEWMDEPCSYEDFRACLIDLEQVNRLTFAYRPTLDWLQSLIGQEKRAIHIVDVGCGGGDMLRMVERWAARRRIDVRLTGIDLNPYAARAAAERTSSKSKIAWVTGDAFSYEPEVPIDLVISSLFTHHLPDDEIVRFLAWMERVTQRGWFVNDLHREPFPYYGFALLARVMRWHRFVQHDGPVSIRRGFRADDWSSYLAAAGVGEGAAHTVTYRPARLCVSRVKV
ncbi:methylase involved in ubiquinone/menaquinone biosynthesis [Terriglobus roseus DSM 18391]|uniref:Methylase involved in ubiquinone/menaquinone biosynthesis n=1 Tax=Terriglobus roseus (strain DSM 18391 / NRRL B-41598 / KBS 63) TaxID=926566 RepID=I3ZMJ2_TERRK|nr:methyltransferase domain-containing protein [Terriglobus roseus]AFL90460.1 methylase involved in ubiquinone/menaquinone biosynthesis [Terriglobus roseus DSM 18391]